MRSLVLIAVAVLLVVGVAVWSGTGSDDPLVAQDVSSRERDIPEDVELAVPRPTASVDPIAHERERAAPIAPQHGTTESTSTEIAEGFARLTVRVVLGGEPVVDARVQANLMERVVGELDEEGTARTDARGRVRFDVRPGRTITIRAAAPGEVWWTSEAFTSPFAGRSRDVTLSLGGTRHEGEFRLRVVSFPSGDPIERATVVARAEGGRVEGDTDPWGEQVLAWRPEMTIVVDAEGHEGREIRGPGTAPGEPLIVELRRHARLSGHVRTPGFGTVTLLIPVSPSENDVRLDEARGLLEGTGPSLARPNGRWIRTEQCKVAEDGSWSLEGLEVPAEVEAWHELGLRLRQEGITRLLADDITLAPGDDLAIVDDWTPGVDLVVDFVYADGSPAPYRRNAYLSRAEDPTDATFTARVDENGRARFGQVPTGRWSLRAGAFEATVHHHGGDPVVLTATGTGIVSGEVVGGAGLNGGQVSLEPTGGGGAAQNARVESDGTFRFDFVPHGRVFLLSGAFLDSTGRLPGAELGSVRAHMRNLKEQTVRAGDRDVRVEIADH